VAIKMNPDRIAASNPAVRSGARLVRGGDILATNPPTLSAGCVRVRRALCKMCI